MPRGKYVNHKGKSRKFTNPDELEEQRKQDELERRWRKSKGVLSSDEDEEGSSTRPPPKGSDDSDSEEESSSEEDENAKGKGVEKLIQISNPNRVQQKSKKLSTLNETLNTSVPQERTRKEMEEIQRQRDAAHYQKLHAEGKTTEAQADLARLAIIKQRREEAAKKKEAEKLKKEEEAKLRAAAKDKALGRKS